MTVETTTLETTTKNLLTMATQMSLRAQFEQVKKEILVPLDQSLRIDLPMLELLVSVPLDPLQESSQGHLLLSPQSGLLLLNYCLYLLFLGHAQALVLALCTLHRHHPLDSGCFRSLFDHKMTSLSVCLLLQSSLIRSRRIVMAVLRKQMRHYPPRVRPS